LEELAARPRFNDIAEIFRIARRRENRGKVSDDG